MKRRSSRNLLVGFCLLTIGCFTLSPDEDECAINLLLIAELEAAYGADAASPTSESAEAQRESEKRVLQGALWLTYEECLEEADRGGRILGFKVF